MWQMANLFTIHARDMFGVAGLIGKLDKSFASGYSVKWLSKWFIM